MTAKHGSKMVVCPGCGHRMRAGEVAGDGICPECGEYIDMGDDEYGEYDDSSQYFPDYD